MTFRSALVPPYVRKTKTLEAAPPWLYRKGISTGEIQEVLSVYSCLYETGHGEAPNKSYGTLWGHHFRAFVGMVLIVVFKPSGQHPKHSICIRKAGELNVIPLEGFDKRFAHTGALRIFD